MKKIGKCKEGGGITDLSVEIPDLTVEIVTVTILAGSLQSLFCEYFC